MGVPLELTLKHSLCGASNAQRPQLLVKDLIKKLWIYWKRTQYPLKPLRAFYSCTSKPFCA